MAASRHAGPFHAGEVDGDTEGDHAEDETCETGAGEAGGRPAVPLQAVSSSMTTMPSLRLMSAKRRA
jgi:hypothetical protein